MHEGVDMEDADGACCKQATEYTFRVPLSRRTVEDAKHRRANPRLVSDVFTVGGYSWRLRVFPAGNVSSSRDFLSCFVHLADAEVLERENMPHAEMTFTVVNHPRSNRPASDDEEDEEEDDEDDIAANVVLNDLHKSSDHTYNANEDDWGFSKLIRHEELFCDDQNYIVNGLVTIKVRLVVTGRRPQPIPAEPLAPAIRLDQAEDSLPPPSLQVCLQPNGVRLLITGSLDRAWLDTHRDSIHVLLSTASPDLTFSFNWEGTTCACKSTLDLRGNLLAQFRTFTDLVGASASGSGARESWDDEVTLSLPRKAWGLMDVVALSLDSLDTPRLGRPALQLATTGLVDALLIAHYVNNANVMATLTKQFSDHLKDVAALPHTPQQTLRAAHTLAPPSSHADLLQVVSELPRDVIASVVNQCGVEVALELPADVVSLWLAGSHPLTVDFSTVLIDVPQLSSLCHALLATPTVRSLSLSLKQDPVCVNAAPPHEFQVIGVCHCHHCYHRHSDLRMDILRRSIAQLPALETLRLVKSSLHAGSIAALCAALSARAGDLRCLSLAGSLVGWAVAIMLPCITSMVEPLRVLESLDLKDNSWTVDVTELAALSSTMPSLRRLDLTGNEVGLGADGTLPASLVGKIVY